MSTIKLTGTSSGSSIIKAPDSGSTNQTFTLPASSGTLVTTTDAGVAGITSAADATAITIDSNEQVTMGGTTLYAGQGNTATGQHFENTGTGYLSRTAGYALGLNRNTSDGTIINFARQGSSVGSIDASASGISIKLGGTATANTLDDYEEGTWTPTLIGSGGGTGTWASSTNTYTKVGRAVHFTAYLNCTSVGNASNALIIGGLPFTNASAGGYQSVVCGNATGLAIGAGNCVAAFVNINDTRMYVKLWNATTGTAAYGFYISELTADGSLMLSGTYFTA